MDGSLFWRKDSCIHIHGRRIILPITTHGKMRHPADYDNLD